MIKTQKYNFNNVLLCNKVIVSYVDKFWIEVFNDIKDVNHLMILCKIKFVDEGIGYRTLGHLVKVNFEDKNSFIEYLTNRLTIVNESYTTSPISKMIFSYIIKDGKGIDSDRELFNYLEDRKTLTHNFNNMVLPISMDPNDFGQIELDNYIQIDSKEYHRFIVNSGSKTFRIDMSPDNNVNKVTILGNINLSWVDTKIEEGGLELIKREIKKSTIYFLDGQIVLRKQMLNAPAFKKLSCDRHILNKFFTLDIETVKLDYKLVPYLICAYDGSDFITSYNKDPNELFKTFFEQLISKVEKGSTT
jgi:hypothetical protein